MNRMGGRPATLQEQLQTLVTQYRNEMAQVEAHGGAGAPEAQRHLENANRIREILTRFSQQRNQAQQQHQQAAQQAQQAQNQPPIPQQPAGFDQQQLYGQQVHAQQGQQGAMANMRVMSSLQQHQQQIEDLRRLGTTLDGQVQAAANALRTVDNNETRQRLMRNIQSMRAKREQVRQRETLTTQNLASMRQRMRQQGTQGGAAAASGPGGPGGPAPGGAAGSSTPIPAAAGGAMQTPASAAPSVGGAGSGVLPSAVPTGVPPAPQQSAAAMPAPGQTPSNGMPTPTPGTPTNRPTQSMPIPQHLNVQAPNPVTVRAERPTLMSGGAVGAAALNSPALSRIPQFEVGSDRVLSKRRLSELVAGILGEDTETLFDGDVEELLLDLADEFVTSVTTFACRLAKHRKSDTLEVKDVQAHLERNWNLRIPGFSADEVRSIRKIAPTSSYQQKVQGVNMSKSVNK